MNQPFYSVLPKAVLALITSYGTSSVTTTSGLLRDKLIVKHTRTIRGEGTSDCGTNVELPNPQYYIFPLWYLCNFRKTQILWWASIYIFHS